MLGLSGFRRDATGGRCAAVRSSEGGLPQQIEIPRQVSVLPSTEPL